jgi:hypothetical protein
MPIAVRVGLVGSSNIWRSGRGRAFPRCRAAQEKRAPASIRLDIPRRRADGNADGPILEFLGARQLDDDPGIGSAADRPPCQVLKTRNARRGLHRARLYRCERTPRNVCRARRSAGFRSTGSRIDSADASYIQPLIAWGKANYPAKHYAADLRHADGRTICPDEESKRHMGIAELTDADRCRSVDVSPELCNMGGIGRISGGRPRFSADVR